MTSVRSLTLADVAMTVQYGYTASSSEDPVGPHYLRITDIVPNQIDWDTVPYCEANEQAIEKFGLKEKDIVIARTGATVGYAKQIRYPPDSVFASYLVRVQIDVEKADPEYVGKVVTSAAYKRFVWSRIGGAAQPNANAKVLTSFPLPLPERGAQHRIAQMVTVYDDLIENNRRRVKLLEQAARELYKEWFVRLRYPGHEHAKVVDGVPEGWGRLSLREIATLNYGKALKAADRIPGAYPVYGSSGVVGTHVRPLTNGPGIIVGRKGNVGSVYWEFDDYWPIDTVYFVDHEESGLFLYLALAHTAFTNTDVAVPGLNRNFAYSRNILFPSEGVKANFEKFLAPLFTQVRILTKYNDKLSRARDFLLPKLISGEIVA